LGAGEKMSPMTGNGGNIPFKRGNTKNAQGRKKGPT